MPFLPLDEVLPKESRGWPEKEKLSQYDFETGRVFIPWELVDQLREALDKEQCCVIIAPPNHGKTFLAQALIWRTFSKGEITDIWYCSFSRHTTLEEIKNHLELAAEWKGGSLHVIEDYHQLYPEQVAELYDILHKFTSKNSLFLLTRRRLSTFPLEDDPIWSDLLERENVKAVLELDKELNYFDYSSGIIDSFIRSAAPDWEISEDEKRDFVQRVGANPRRVWKYLKVGAEEVPKKPLHEIDETEVLRRDYHEILGMEDKFSGSKKALSVISAISRFEGLGVQLDYLQKRGVELERAAWYLTREGYLESELSLYSGGRYFHLWNHKDGEWWLRAVGYGEKGIAGDPLGLRFVTDYCKEVLLDYLRMKPLPLNYARILEAASQEGEITLVTSVMLDEEAFANIEEYILSQSIGTSLTNLLTILRVLSSGAEKLPPCLESRCAVLCEKWMDSKKEELSDAIKKMTVSQIVSVISIATKVSAEKRHGILNSFLSATKPVLPDKLCAETSFGSIVSLLLAIYEMDPGAVSELLSIRQVGMQMKNAAEAVALRRISKCLRETPLGFQTQILTRLVPEELTSKVKHSSANAIAEFLIRIRLVWFKKRFLHVIQKSDFCDMVSKSSAEALTELVRFFNYATSDDVRKEGSRIIAYLDASTARQIIMRASREAGTQFFYSIALLNRSATLALIDESLGVELVNHSRAHEASWLVGHLVGHEELLLLAKRLVKKVELKDWEKLASVASPTESFWLVWFVYQASQDVGQQLATNLKKNLISKLSIKDFQSKDESTALLGLLSLCNVPIVDVGSLELTPSTILSKLNRMLSPTCFFLGLELIKRDVPSLKGTALYESLLNKLDEMTNGLGRAVLTTAMRSRFQSSIELLNRM